MTHLVSLIRLKTNTLLRLRPSLASGGMLTESQNFIEQKNIRYLNHKSVPSFLFAKKPMMKPHAICKSDMMIKGDNPENIKVGSTLLQIACR